MEIILELIFEVLFEFFVLVGDYLFTRKRAKKHFIAESLPKTKSFKKEIKLHRSNVRKASRDNRQEVKERQSDYWSIMKKFRKRIPLWIILGVIGYFVYFYLKN